VRHSSRAISPRDQRGDGSPRSEGAAKRVSSRATGVVWGLFDQFLSSATNLVGSIVAAQRLTKAGFGAWSVAFSLAVVMLGISRALAADPLTIRYSASTPQTQRLEISRVFAVPLVGGVAVGLVLAGTGLLLDSTLGRVLAVVGFSLPFLLFQDCCRLVLFMQGRAFSAAMNDLVWLIATVAALGLLSGRPSPPWLIGLCWTSGAALAAGFGYWQIGIRPGLSPGVWVKRHADLCLPFSIDFLLTAGVTYVVVFGLAAFRSVESTASFRGAHGPDICPVRRGHESGGPTFRPASRHIGFRIGSSQRPTLGCARCTGGVLARALCDAARAVRSGSPRSDLALGQGPAPGHRVDVRRHGCRSGAISRLALTGRRRDRPTRPPFCRTAYRGPRARWRVLPRCPRCRRWPTDREYDRPSDLVASIPEGEQEIENTDGCGWNWAAADKLTWSARRAASATAPLASGGPRAATKRCGRGRRVRRG
jgi:hypothetical protein